MKYIVRTLIVLGLVMLSVYSLVIIWGMHVLLFDCIPAAVIYIVLSAGLVFVNFILWYLGIAEINNK